LIVSIAFLVTWKVKYSGVLWIFLLVFLGMEYYERLSDSSRYMWAIVICFVSAIFCIYQVISDVKEH